MDAKSSAILANMNPGAGLHPDFGSGLWDGGRIGIPFDVVPGSQPLVPVDFEELGWPEESDPGPYPVPADPQIEGEPGNASGDRHVLILQTGSCTLHELYYVYPDGQNGCAVGTGGWCAASGARWSLGSNALRPAGWTSADAAGLPIFAGLVRWDEVVAGEIDHALRFTASCTTDAYLWPARHEAGVDDPDCPPMGARFRLRADFDLSAFGPKATEVAARIGDGLWLTSADDEAIKNWRDAGGTGPIYGQVTLCWAASPLVQVTVAPIGTSRAPG